MSDLKISVSEISLKRVAIRTIIGGFIASIVLLGALGLLFFGNLPVGQATASRLSWLFAMNSTHTTWYITRAAGWVAYLLLWFSTVWGLLLPIKPFGRFLSPTFTYDFHEFISLLSIGFVALHVAVLLADQYLPYTLAQILVPFLSPYRPVWVGLGVLGFYLMLLVTVTFYLRKQIGQQRFKAIHVLSLAGYFGALLHSFFSGSDSSLGMAQLTYLSTFLVVVFLTAYWLINGRQIKKEKEEQARLVLVSRSTRRPTRKVV